MHEYNFMVSFILYRLFYSVGIIAIVILIGVFVVVILWLLLVVVVVTDVVVLCVVCLFVCLCFLFVQCSFRLSCYSVHSCFIFSNKVLCSGRMFAMRFWSHSSVFHLPWRVCFEIIKTTMTTKTHRWGWWWIRRRRAETKRKGGKKHHQWHFIKFILILYYNWPRRTKLLIVPFHSWLCPILWRCNDAFLSNHKTSTCLLSYLRMDRKINERKKKKKKKNVPNGMKATTTSNNNWQWLGGSHELGSVSLAIDGFVKNRMRFGDAR